MVSTFTQSLIEQLRQGPASALELTQRLGISRQLLSRLMQSQERAGRIVRLGVTRGVRYGLARAVGSVGSAWPLYLIDELGQPEQIATVHAIERDRFFVNGGPDRIQGSFEGLPYYLQDARPGGFLGRAIPTAHPDLGLPARVVDWTDHHVLIYLTQRGSETTGNLILGTEALDRYLAGTHGPPIVTQGDREQTYMALAAAAMHGAPPGSSAHGEHPKFAVRVTRDAERTDHALVKFSPSRTTPVGVRWADLLIAEHIASAVLPSYGIPTARSELLESGDQVFLESQRFDRVGSVGRRGVVSLLSLDTAQYGRLDSWTASAGRLLTDGLLDQEDAERLAIVDTFGGLIANSDRHFGNVTLFDDYSGRFRLAPIYDTLPMLFAPQDGHIVDRAFAPAGPTAASLAAWPIARPLAEEYWQRLIDDGRISPDFRRLSTDALRAVQALPARAAPRVHVA